MSRTLDSGRPDAELSEAWRVLEDALGTRAFHLDDAAVAVDAAALMIGFLPAFIALTLYSLMELLGKLSSAERLN